MAENKTKKINTTMGRVEPREIVEEMKASYIDYAMSVIVSRALPDVRDGLKPVHRRILFAMDEDGLRHDAKYRKSATVVGSVLGRYHPHGDIAVYDSMARMAQDFSLRYPLIDGQGNWGCFTKDTKVRLCDGRDLSFEELIKEQEKGKKHWTFTFNPEAKKIEITEIKNPRLTRKKEKIIEITLDNNEKIRCTLNHRFMIRDGAYREAQDLKQGDSLMPLYTELFNGEDKNLKGYETVFQPIKNEREFVHHLADEWNLEHAVYGKSAGRIRHHSDFNKLNNNPDNILRIQWQDHWRYHREIASERHKNDLEYVKKIAEGRKKYIENNRQVFSLRAINLNKKLWASAEFRKKHSERIKKMWQNPVYKEYMREASSKNLKKLWRREDFQKLLSALKSEEMKKRWENEEYRVSKIQEMRVVSLKMWSDPKYREHMSKLMTERFLNPELRKKQSRISKKLWQNAEYRQKTLKMIKEAWQSPERRAKYEKDYFSNMAKKLWQNPATRQFHHEKMLRQRENQEFLNKNKEGLRKLYIRRIKENPNYIDELTEKAKVALNKNWQDPLYKKRVMKSKILRYVFNLSRGYSKITPKIYEKERINNGVPALRNALNYFSNFEEIIEQAPKYNHKVIRVKILKKREDVYDLTVDPWHNFALAAGIFVHNSIDDPGEFAAMRYCITGDSLAVTNRCVEKISTISDKEDVSLNVLSFGKKINPASKWFDSGIHPVLEIKTFRNYSLKGTYNHPILTITNGSQGRPVFKWKLLENIEKGDYAVIDRSEALWPSKEPDLKKYHPMGGKENKNSHPKIYKLPSRMTPDLAFLLGAILAEGYVSRGKQRGNYKIGFCNTNKEFNDEFRGKFKKLFPECSPYELERKPVGYGKKNFLSFEICSKRLVEFFENLGLKGVASQEKRVPEPIFHSTKKSVGEFLKGYFEGDGGVFRNINSFWVEGSSSSEGLIKEIQTILLRFGIVSSACPNLKRGEFKLLIRGFKNLDNFNNKIGFLTEEKKKKLSEYSQINSDGRIMPKTDFIPFLSQYLRKKYANNKGVNCSSRRWILTHNLDRYLKLQKYCKKLEKILDEPDLQLVESFIDNNYLFDQVVAVEKREAEKVYSLRVDSPCHSFVANGFINHNTECRMSKIGEEMLKDTEKDTVNFTENYDGTRKEPTVLPSPLPQLLLNGSLGIAVGMATNIPPHNLSEVVDGLVYLIDNQKADTEDLFKFIKGPDFPLGGEIFDQKEIILAYSQGKGPILTRAKTEIVEQEKGARRQIIVSEIPFQVQKSVLLEHIAELVQEKKIEGIKDIRDESDKEGMRIVIDLNKDAFPQKVLNQLYKHSDLQKTFHLNMLALVDGIQPRVLNLVEMLNYFLLHRKEVITRRTKYELDKCKERAHILEGLHKCLGNIDEVIRIIKNSQDREDAKLKLMKRFRLSEIQANAILETKLAALAKLERQKIEDELKEIQARIKELAAVLSSPQRIKELVKKELKEIKDNFGDERRTKVHLQKMGEIAEEDLVPAEECMLTLTQGGYVKRIDPETYKLQKRGGKGIMGMKTVGEDIVEHFITCNTHDRLLFFTDSGKVFQSPAYEIPEGTRVAKGRGLLNFLEISPEEKVLSLIPLSKEEYNGARNLVMVTKNGIIKKTELAEFKNVRRNGLIAINLKKGDSLRAVQKSTGEDEIILATKKGQSIRFEEKQIREMGRQASGIRGIRLKKGDEVIGMEIIKMQNAKIKMQNYLLVVMDNGYGKRTDVKEYRIQGRGGAGIKTAKVTPKTGDLISIKILEGAEEDLIVISKKAQVIRTPVSAIPKLSRATQGVRIMRLDEGDKVVSVACM